MFEAKVDQFGAEEVRQRLTKSHLGKLDRALRSVKGFIRHHPAEVSLIPTVIASGVAYDFLSGDHVLLRALGILPRIIISDTLTPGSQADIAAHQAEFTTDPIVIAAPAETPQPTPSPEPPEPAGEPTPDPTPDPSPTSLPTNTPLSPTPTPTPTQSALMEVTPTEKQEQEYKYQINSPVPEAEKGNLKIFINTQMKGSPSGINYMPSNTSSPIPIYAVWDGELQPGRIFFSGKTLYYLTIKNSGSIEAGYLFDGDIEGDSLLPRKVRAGEKIGNLNDPLPPSPFDPNVKSWLSLNFQTREKSNAAPNPLNVQDFHIK